jgi:hypothetical protein
VCVLVGSVSWGRVVGYSNKNVPAAAGVYYYNLTVRPEPIAFTEVLRCAYHGELGIRRLQFEHMPPQNKSCVSSRAIRTGRSRTGRVGLQSAPPP